MHATQSLGGFVFVMEGEENPCIDHLFSPTAQFTLCTLFNETRLAFPSFVLSLFEFPEQQGIVHVKKVLLVFFFTLKIL